VGLLVQRFATVCDEWTADVFEIGREVEECLGPQEEAARHFLPPTQTQSPSPVVNGAPPKVIWLHIGNASTATIEAFIRSALVKIRTFEISAEESLLVLS
jgi:hypothetical protein